MAPKQPSIDLLFHPKKNKKPQQPPPQHKTPPTPRPKPTNEKKDEDEGGLQLPDWPFQEFRLLSSALNGWKYDVMKFDSRKVVDVSRWTAPVKLNRKDLRKDEPAAAGEPQAVGPMLGPDGKPVIGADGKMVMVDAEGKPIHAADGTSRDKGKAAANAAAAKKRFQKKTKQVFYVPEEVRQLRKEERYPWVIEDSHSSNKELWIGQLEDIGKAETHAFFMPAANDVFKFVPAHRWYKFQKKLKHSLPTDTAGVEQLYTTSQKRDPQAWLATRNGGRGPSAATAAMFKAEAEGRTITIGNSLVHDAGQSLGPGGRRLKTVDSGMDHLFGDEDEDGEANKRKAKELGGEGDMDEQIYEEDFADDDEHAAPDDDDEEAKDVEERLKREYRAANKHREAGVDDEEEETEGPGMSKQAKAMQKLIRNREGNDAYESDEEKNPYASSEEEEEEEELPVHTGPAVQQQPQQVDVRSKSQTPKPGDGTKQQADSRATSPAASPSLGGHSIVAKRATSPKAPKSITQNVSKGNSPAGSRATSPAAGSRATSPVANGQKLTSVKRKADDLSSAGPSGANGQPKAKKRREVAPVTPEELQALLIDWLRTTPKEKSTTRDCIQHFTPYLTDQSKKAEFSKMVRDVAMLKDGVLALR
ncbi:hypothetical protein P691DRAFT_613695, partial [Macrolepiota fuliginosa MF-IS2]